MRATTRSGGKLGLLIVENEVARGAASVVHAVRSTAAGDAGSRLALKSWDAEARALHSGAAGFEASIDPGLARFRGVHETGDLPRDRLHRVTDLVRGAPATLAELGSLRRTVFFWARVARALGKAHARGFSHGYVRTAHAVVLPGDAPFVLDAGVVPTVAGARRAPETALFLAPEAVEDLLEDRLPRATPRADVYGLGASLVVALGGSAPGARGLEKPLPLAGLLDAKRSARAPVVAASAVPQKAVDLRALDQALARALDPDSEARFADANGLALALEAAARLEPERSRVPTNRPSDTRRIPRNDPSDTRRVIYEDGGAPESESR
jgi:hypothetical protein